VRPDNPRTLPDSDKPAKYESPRGIPNRVYLPPRVRECFADRSVPILFVEGEFKALAADQHGYAAIGLVGVNGWSKAKESDDEERQPHPDIKDIVWKGRRVYIVLDSDAVYKDDPRREEWALGARLIDHDANVRVVRLPAKLGGPKVGLDDFFKARGKAAWRT
jgi:hypothetical protein